MLHLFIEQQDAFGIQGLNLRFLFLSVLDRLCERLGPVENLVYIGGLAEVFLRCSLRCCSFTVLVQQHLAARVRAHQSLIRATSNALVEKLAMVHVGKGLRRLKMMMLIQLMPLLLLNLLQRISLREPCSTNLGAKYSSRAPEQSSNDPPHLHRAA